MSQVKIAIWIVIFLIISGLSATVYFMYGSIQEKNVKLATLKTELDTVTLENVKWQTQLSELTAVYARAQTDIGALNLKLGAAKTRSEYIKRDYEAYKGRKSVVLAKPLLIEKMANNATERVFKDLSCATGNVDECGSKK